MSEMSEDTGPSQDDRDADFSLEVTPLIPPSLDGHNTQVARSHLALRVWRLLPVGGAVLILVLVLSGLPQLRSAFTRTRGVPATPTETPRFVSSSSSQVTMGTPVTQVGDALPSCPPGNASHIFSPQYGPGVGMSGLDIWLVGFSGSSATLRVSSSQRTKLGWPFKLILVASATVTQPITLGVIGTFNPGGTAWISPGNLGQTSTTVTFDPHAATATAGGWRSWPLTLFIPTAGCYFLNATAGGSQVSGTFFAVTQ